MFESRSDVYSQELDLSASIRLLSNTYGGFAGMAERGPVGWQFVSGKDALVEKYGIPAAKYGSAVISACKAFNLGMGGAWFNRVVNAAATEGALLIQNKEVSGDRAITRLAQTIGYAVDPNFATIGTASTIDDNVLLIRAIGPGSYSGNIKVEVIDYNIKAPTNIAAALVDPPAGVTSTLTAAAHKYNVVAVRGVGTTQAGTEASATVTSGKGVRVTWDAVPGATLYRVYRQIAAGAYMLLDNVPPNATSYNDYGATAKKTETPPAVNTIAVNKVFTLNVYEGSGTRPVETHQVSLDENIDAGNNQTEIESVINRRSKRIRVQSNVKAMSATPQMISFPPTALGTGSAAATVTTGEMIAAWDGFEDRKKYPCAALVNHGYTVDAYRKHLAQLAINRKYTLSLLDVPSTKQDAWSAIEDRAVDLAVNSSQSALFTNDHLMFDEYSNGEVWVPPSGVVMGLLAFTDRIANASYSPAGVNRGLVAETIRLRHDYTPAEMNALADAQVNYFSTERSYGTLLKEAYTLQVDYSSVSHIAVRRIINIAEEATEEGLKQFLQDPNNVIHEMQVLAALREFYDLMLREELLSRAEVFSRTDATDRANGNKRLITVIEPYIPTIRILHTTVISGQGPSFNTIVEQLTN